MSMNKTNSSIPSARIAADGLGDTRDAYFGLQSSNVEKGQYLGIIKNQAQMLLELGQQVQGRGVPKNDMTPAQRNGLNPQNPQFFGIQQKTPVPYEKIIGNGQNLTAVLKGFQNEENKVSGAMPMDAANIISQIEKKNQVVSAAFNKQRQESLYAGVPKDPAVNLYNIELKNLRENSLYSFQ